MRFRTAGVLAVVVPAVIVLAGCSGAPSAAPGPNSSPAATDGATPTAPPVTPTGVRPTTPAARERQAVFVHRTGGFIGVDETLVVATDGHWTYGNGTRGTQQVGSLTAAQRDKLQGLLASPRLADEARRPTSGTCADGFIYTVVVGSLRVMMTDCGGSDEPPTVSAIIAL
ncbi:MAG TPA: hypothetical protein VFE14_02795, partial [Micromonosporaceae bacterium]|nr:hypothetical protein [Micromonosporaceae bacterium]